jgi:hypothetical protein
VLVAAAVALAAAVVVPPLLRTVLRETPVAELLDIAGFAATYLLVLWLAVGPRRLAAMEILVWGSRYATAGYRAVTGIRDSTDAGAAAAWLRAHPAPAGAAPEDPEVRYWRAYAHLVAGDLPGARTVLASLAGTEGYGYAVASLEAQIALADGSEPDLRAVESAAMAWSDPLGRAVAMANLGALRAQRAFVCGEDHVAPVLTVRAGVGGRPSRYFLTRAWLPIIAVTIGSIALGRAIGSP